MPNAVSAPWAISASDALMNVRMGISGSSNSDPFSGSEAMIHAITKIGITAGWRLSVRMGGSRISV